MEAEVTDAQTKLENGKAEAAAKLADARQKLENAQAQIDSGKVQLENSKAEVARKSRPWHRSRQKFRTEQRRLIRELCS